jgi:hypothetical protein
LDLALWIDPIWKEFRQADPRGVALLKFLLLGFLLLLLFLSLA